MTTHYNNLHKTQRDLANWDAKIDPSAPLTDRQKDGFLQLTSLSSHRPLPAELPAEEGPSVNTPPSPTHSFDNEDQFSLGDMEQIGNAQTFFLWFSEIEEKMAGDEDLPLREQVEDLEANKSECNKILSEVSGAVSFLEELREKYVRVSTKTNALHEACEHLLAEQTKLVNTADSITNKLAYFNELERMSSKLSSPTMAVNNESMVPMLSRLDECMAYLHKNPHYKESEVYTSRFRNCLSRALGLIRVQVTSLLQAATQQVLPKKDIVSTNDDAFTLFYGKFRTNAPRVKSLVEELEQRVDKSPEYKQTLSDCHQCYFQQRVLLLGPSVSNAVAELATKHARDQCALMRSGCAFMIHVCEDEYKLYSHFFSARTQQLDSMLEVLCSYLYDIFRPLIIHINHLETLAELCSILKIEMLEEHVMQNNEELGAFETICLQMLEDVQERLVYRTHIYIRSEILSYNPAQGDLAYPDKLEMMESIAKSLKKKQHSRTPSVASSTSAEEKNAATEEVEQINSDALSQEPSDNVRQELEVDIPTDTFVTVPLEGTSNMPMSPADLHGMWYPTVRRTLVCLSKLYRCIDRNTFQGLSQEALTMCIHSLVHANASISKNKTPLDGNLFLIKHLLILREQIAPFQVDFSVKETGLDFSKIKDAAYCLFQHKSNMFTMNSNNALLQFLLDGTPQVTETFLDSKKEVDSQLKKTCEDFIQTVTKTLVGTLQDFLSKADVILEMQKEDGAPKLALRQQPFAKPDIVRNVVAQTYRELKQKKAQVQRSMTVYLANKDTEYILFKPIKVNVQQNFTQLWQLLQDHYSDEDQQVIGCPSMEQINLLLSSHNKAGV